MELFKWLPGRQSTCKYLKYCFLWRTIGRFGFDGYILKYPPNAQLPIHKDEVYNSRHYRLNIILKRKSDINYVQGWNTIINWFDSRIILFRPDLWEHGMRNGDGERIVLSLGMVIKNKI